jgi:hypothetical protein
VLALVYDGISTVYANGQVVNSGANARDGCGNPFQIGRWLSGPLFQWSIDDVRLWQGRLQEIADIMLRGDKSIAWNPARPTAVVDIRDRDLSWSAGARTMQCVLRHRRMP